MKEYLPHVWKEGSREHVISYVGTVRGSFQRCSEPDCAINSQWDEHIKDKPMLDKIINSMRERGRQAKEG